MNPKHPPDCGWHRDWHNCSCGLFNTVFWNEVGEGGVVRFRYTSAEEAILIQSSNSSKNYHDQWECLQDFLKDKYAWIG